MKYLHIILVVLLVTSCNNLNENRKRDTFSQKLNEFNSDYYSHFPHSAKPIYTTYISESGKYVAAGAQLLHSLEKESFKILKDSISIVSIAKYNASDSCLLIVDMFTNEDNWFERVKATSKELDYFKSDCLKNKLPIPNFWTLDIPSNSMCKLPEKFELFVLDAKSGIVDNKKYISNFEYMPELWKHGYSKGYALNQETREVIYWFVIW